MEKDKPKMAIDGPAKESLVAWVSDFLSYWEDAFMTSDKAAEIIVNNILTCQLGEGQNDPNRLPNPQSFFESQESN